jgi:hypothetical protein
MLRDIRNAAKDIELADQYLYNLERLIKLAPHVKDVLNSTKFHIKDWLTIHGFLQTLDWLLDESDSQ